MAEDLATVEYTFQEVWNYFGSLQYGKEEKEKIKDLEKFENLKNKITEELKNAFNPEFLNRVDDIVIFKQLNEDESLKIIDLTLQEVVEKLEEKNIKFQLSEGAKKFLADKGFELLMGHFKEGSTIQVKLKGKSELVFSELKKDSVSDKKTESDVHQN